jgi:hypothetical protein
MRHYKSLNPRWAIFLTSAVDLAYRNFTQKSQDQKYSLDGFSGGLRLTPGISYFVTPRFALETDINLLSLGAGYQKFDGSESFYFSSAVTTSLTSYFSVRASWYIQKP